MAHMQYEKESFFHKRDKLLLLLPTNAIKTNNTMEGSLRSKQMWRREHLFCGSKQKDENYHANQLIVN